MAEIAKLFVSVDADMKGMQGKLDKLGPALKKVGMAATAMGAVITGVMAKSVIDYAKAGDEVHKMGLRTGFATDALSRLKYAAAIGGAGLEDIEKAAKRMAATLYDAKEGLSTSVDALANLNMTVEEFEGLSPEDSFMKLAGAISAIEDPLKRSALAQRIFGKAGTELLPMLSEGTEGLKAMMDEAERFAPIFDKEAAEAAAKFTDTMGQLKGTTDKLKFAIADNLVPALLPFIEKMRDAVAGISVWMKENPGLTKTIVLIVAAVGGLLLVLGPLLIFLPGIISLLPILGAAFAVLTGPVGLIIAAVIALIAVGVLLVKNWDKVGAAFKAIWEGIKTAFQNVVVAIINGINKLIMALNKVSFTMPSWLGGGTFGINIKTIAIPKFGEGAIVTRPTIGMIGEKGPEAVMPLSKMGRGMGTVINIYPQALLGTEQQVISWIKEALLTDKGSNVSLGLT